MSNKNSLTKEQRRLIQSAAEDADAPSEVVGSMTLFGATHDITFAEATYIGLTDPETLLALLAQVNAYESALKNIRAQSARLLKNGVQEAAVLLRYCREAGIESKVLSVDDDKNPS